MIKVLIAEDHPLMLDALRACLEDEPDIEIVAEAGKGEEAVRAALRARPDVMVIDLFLPDMDGISVVRQVLAANPEARALIITSSLDEDRVAEAVQAGVLGYLIKDSPREEILKAIREVGQGRSYFSATVAKKLANVLRKGSSRANSFVEPLTKREEDILALISEGASNAEIARGLHIGETTVRTHVFHILQKMGFKNRSELMMHLLQQKRKG